MLRDFKSIFAFILSAHLLLMWMSFEQDDARSNFVKKAQGTISGLSLNIQKVAQREVLKNKIAKVIQKPSPVMNQNLKTTQDSSYEALSTVTVDQNMVNDQKTHFKQQLRAEIEKHKSYPVISRRLGQTGIVEVAFTLLEDGHIINVRLSRPSPFERLNESAINAVKKVHKFFPIPREWGENKMDILVSLKFVTI
jgi:TonB family protein